MNEWIRLHRKCRSMIVWDRPTTKKMVLIVDSLRICGNLRILHIGTQVARCWTAVKLQRKLGPSWAQVGSCSAQLKAKAGQVWPSRLLVRPSRTVFFTPHPQLPHSFKSNPDLHNLHLIWVRAVLVAERKKEERKKERNKQLNELTHEWIWMNTYMNEWTNERTNEYIYIYIILFRHTQHVFSLSRQTTKNDERGARPVWYSSKSFRLHASNWRCAGCPSGILATPPNKTE